MRPHVGLARANVDDAGIGRRDGQRADRGNRLRIEDREPRAAGVCRLPDAAADRAGIEDAWLTRHPADGVDTAGAERADASPAEAGIERGIDARRLRDEMGDGSRPQRRREGKDHQRVSQLPRRNEECSLHMD